jgi:hypothetical protein
MDVRDTVSGMWIGISWLKYAPVADSCKHVNKHSCSIKGGEFIV